MELSPSRTRYDQSKLNNLLAEVLKHRYQPEDKYEIAAILESNGWTDAKAAAEFGAEDVFALASDLWDAAKTEIRVVPFPTDGRLSLPAYTAMVIRSFLKGTIFALPIAISIIAMFTLRFSLWSYEFLSLEAATGIAIGTLMSFMVVGGFTQAIARRGFMYTTQGYYNMARRMTVYFLKLGYLISALIVAVFLLVNAFFGIFPLNMILLVVVYFFFLSALWLSVTVMYILQKEIIFTSVLVAGILLVFVLYRLLGLNIILSQVIALALAFLGSIWLVFYFFTQAEKKMEKGISPSLPRTSITIYTVLPYFAYGFLYFTFLFVDRLVAWSTTSIYMPYLIWFRGPYELGLDLALLTIILPMGLIEVVVTEFMANMEANQKSHLCRQANLLGKIYLDTYIKRSVIVAVFSLLNAFGIYLGVVSVGLNRLIPMHWNLLGNQITYFVFVIAAVAYAILSVALLNALILFSLSQAEMVCRCILTALAVNLLVGFPLSRWVDHSFAVLGLLFGALVFAYLTTRRVLEVLRNLDYYLYAAS